MGSVNGKTRKGIWSLPEAHWRTWTELLVEFYMCPWTYCLCTVFINGWQRIIGLTFLKDALVLLGTGQEKMFFHALFCQRSEIQIISRFFLVSQEFRKILIHIHLSFCSYLIFCPLNSTPGQFFIAQWKEIYLILQR